MKTYKYDSILKELNLDSILKDIEGCINEVANRSTKEVYSGFKTVEIIESFCICLSLFSTTKSGNTTEHTYAIIFNDIDELNALKQTYLDVINAHCSLIYRAKHNITW